MATDTPVRKRPTLVRQVAEALTQERLLLVTAESCTGGWVAKTFTDMAGSSQFFERGFVAYSNMAKQDMVGVRAETLANHGAVSEPVAREMAEGALQQSCAHVAVAISGIAGPGGGTPEKPVGTVCFAWLREGGVCVSRTEHFSGDREAVRRASVQCAIQGVLDILVR